MFCPKCGSELREGASFCPKCGTKIGNRTEPAAAPVKKIPEFQEIKKNLPEMKQVETFIKSIPPKMAAGIAAAVVILVMAVIFLGRPNMKNLDTEKLTEKYFEDQLDYSENNYMYEACFNYMAQDLTTQLTKKVAPILKTFDLYEPARLEEVQAQRAVDKLTEYFSNESNQKKLIKTITQYSDVEVGEVNKEDGVVTADVTVEYLDISSVNQEMLDDASSVKGFAKLLAKANGMSITGALVTASGDASFVLDAFKEKAEESDARKSYTGTVEFTYDKDEKRWEISQMDSGLLNAYFGIQ